MLAVCQSVCNWAVGQFGSTVLIQGEPITWRRQSLAIGFVAVASRDRGRRPSPLLLYGRLAAGKLAFLLLLTLPA